MQFEVDTHSKVPFFLFPH